jgi:hypothetical protein
MGDGNGSNGYGNKVGGDGDGDNTCDGNGNKVWWATKMPMARVARAMRMATKKAMATVAKVMAMATKRAMAKVREGNVDDGKSNGQQQ